MLLGEEMFFGGQQMTKDEILENLLLFDFGVSCMSTGVGLLNFRIGYLQDIPIALKVPGRSL